MTARKVTKAPVRRNPKLQALMTHEQVAVRLGLTRGRVTQLEASALRKLRKSRVLRELFR